jgi:hypothetical protein
MKATEISPSAHVKKSQPDEFDLLILGGGTGSTRVFICRGTHTKTAFGALHHRPRNTFGRLPSCADAEAASH